MFKNYQRLRSLLLPVEKQKLLFFTILLTLMSLVEIITLLISFSILTILFGSSSVIPDKATLGVFAQIETKNLVLILLGVATLKLASITPIHIFEARLKTQISTRLSTKLYEQYFNLPYLDFISSEKAVLARNVQDVYLVVERSIFPVSAFISEALFLFGLIIILSATAPIYSLAGVVSIALVGLVLSKMNSTLSTSFGDTYNTFAKSCSINTQDGLNSNAEVRMMNSYDYFVEKFNRSCHSKLNALFAKQIFDNVSPHGLEFILIVGTSFIILLLESSGELVSNNLQILSIVLLGALRAIPSIGKLNASFQSMRFGAATFSDLTNDLSTREILPKSDFSEQELIVTNDINFRSISFGYPNSNNELMLKDLTVSFKFGEITAVVGANGAGKTSLINLLTGLFEPLSGEIQLGDTKISTKSRGWKNQIGFVPQELSLINATIFENVVFGRSVITDLENKVDNALEAAGLRDFINGLSHGKHHFIGDNGNKLSGGERQKLGIARAILLRPPVVIFDEISNFLDNLSTNETIKILESFRGEHTVILVTHDKNIMEIADQIIDLDIYGSMHSKKAINNKTSTK